MNVRVPIGKMQTTQWILACYSEDNRCVGFIASQQYNEDEMWEICLQVQNARMFPSRKIATGYRDETTFEALIGFPTVRVIPVRININVWPKDIPV
jgi:hypothetical protein